MKHHNLPVLFLDDKQDFLKYNLPAVLDVLSTEYEDVADFVEEKKEEDDYDESTWRIQRVI